MPTKKSSEPKKPVQETIHTKVKKLEEENKQLQQDVKEKNDKFLRTLADYQNYQKRMEKELGCREDELKKKYLCELLDFQELLKKAYEDNNPKEGLKLLLSNLEKFFEKEKVTSIECTGKPFDYTIHDAVSTTETVDGVDGMVVDEVKKGYLMNGKVLRPCQVIVNKKKETPVGGV